MNDTVFFAFPLVYVFTSLLKVLVMLCKTEYEGYCTSTNMYS